MSRLPHDSATWTSRQLDIAIKLLLRQLQNLAIQREIASYDEDQRLADVDLSDPHALECALIERLASLRRSRTQRGG